MRRLVLILLPFWRGMRDCRNQVDPTLGIALYTKAINGKSIFSMAGISEPVRKSTLRPTTSSADQSATDVHT